MTIIDFFTFGDWIEHEEAHAFSTKAGYSLDVFVVDGWDNEETDQLRSVLLKEISCMEGCQFLWIITFYSTQLPGPNYHCREGSKLATLPPPDNILQSLLIVPRGVLYGCADLIISSHMILSLVFVQTYQKYGTRRYTVNLVVFFIDKTLPELPDHTSALLLPVTKDRKSKEENHKLLNGNSGDPAEWV
ncbi:hypothetical protein KY289_001210 [Solanum tuberosum]|nr:hypothetical protein KY289_001210 [Solanum tuberosum]